MSAIQETPSTEQKLQMPTIGDQLRDLEYQADALLEQHGQELPSPARIILRSVSALFMAARHLWEDQQQPEV